MAERLKMRAIEWYFDQLYSFEDRLFKKNAACNSFEMQAALFVRKKGLSAESQACLLRIDGQLLFGRNRDRFLVLLRWGSKGYFHCND